jgi:hypothetical protein
MADCNVSPRRFASLGRKDVIADFRGGRLTTNAGALLRRETAELLVAYLRPANIDASKHARALLSSCSSGGCGTPGPR